MSAPSPSSGRDAVVMVLGRLVAIYAYAHDADAAGELPLQRFVALMGFDPRYRRERAASRPLDGARTDVSA